MSTEHTLYLPVVSFLGWLDSPDSSPVEPGCQQVCTVRRLNKGEIPTPRPSGPSGPAG